MALCPKAMTGAPPFYMDALRIPERAGAVAEGRFDCDGAMPKSAAPVPPSAQAQRRTCDGAQAGPPPAHAF